MHSPTTSVSDDLTPMGLSIVAPVEPSTQMTSEVAPQGGVEVSAPPNGAGRRGRVMKHDWDLIAAWVRDHPRRWFRYTPVIAGDLDRLKKRYPNILFLGDNYWIQTMSDRSARRVCDVYVATKGTPRD